MAACASQGKAKLQVKASRARSSPEQLQQRQGLNSAQQSRRSRSRVKSEGLQPLKRSVSTIGFPTLEGRVRNTATSRSGHSPKKRRGQGEKEHPGRTLRRSQSLPSLLPLTNSSHSYGALSLTRRVNLNKVHTRIKRLNLEHSGLYSWGKQILMEPGGKKTMKQQGDKKTLGEQGGKVMGDSQVSGGSKVEEGNPRIIQDFGVGQHKHYAVNEAPSWGAGRRSMDSYAKYMVHSLATSARTPEPGSHPTTRL